MRRAAVPFAAALVAGVALLVTAAALDGRRLAFTLGVRQVQVSPKLRPGQEGCQVPVDVTQGFSAVRFKVAGVGVPLAVTIRDARSGLLLGGGGVSGGYAYGARPVVPVGDVPRHSRVAVCVRNAGRRATIGLWGGPAKRPHTTRATLDRRPLGADIGFEFMRARKASVLSLVPAMLQRMALFRPSFVGVWTYWLLLVLLLLAVPAMLLVALAESAGE